MYVLIQKARGKKLTEAIFNFTMCNALLFFYSPESVHLFSSWVLPIKFPLLLTDHDQHLKTTGLIHNLKHREYICKE